MGCHFLLQGIFPTQGSNQCLLLLLHWQAGPLPTEPLGRMQNVWSFISKRAVYSQTSTTVLQNCMFKYFGDRELCFLSLIHLCYLLPVPTPLSIESIQWSSSGKQVFSTNPQIQLKTTQQIDIRKPSCAAKLNSWLPYLSCLVDIVRNTQMELLTTYSQRTYPGNGSCNSDPSNSVVLKLGCTLQSPV